MNNKIILTLILFTMFFIGIQAAQPAAAVKKINQFNNYYIGGGQNDDTDVFKVYEYSANHVYITIQDTIGIQKPINIIKVITGFFTTLKRFQKLN